VILKHLVLERGFDRKGNEKDISLFILDYLGTTKI